MYSLCIFTGIGFISGSVYLFEFSTTLPTTEELGQGASGSDVHISV
jgi:hypothetical protein